jgi:hypothetical protein
MSDSSERLHRPKADTIEISDLLSEARAGKYELPDFQRDLKWREEDRSKLFDSIYRGFPIGDILFWEPEEPRRGSNRFGPFQPPARMSSPWLVVDGQQRLSTLFGCLLVPEHRLEDPDPDPEWRFAFDTDKLRIVRLPQNPGPELLPLPIAIDTARYLKWTRTLPEDDRRDERMQAGDDFSKALRTYRIPYYVVRTHDRKLLQQVFERVNTTGKSLEGTDVFNALFPTRLNDVAKKLEPLGFGWVEPDWLLQAAKVMVGMDPAGHFGKQLNSVDDGNSTLEDSGLLLAIVDEAEARPMREKLEEIGPELEMASTLAITLLQEMGIRRVEILPYPIILPILTHFFHRYPEVSTRNRGNLIRFAWQVSAGASVHRNRATYLRRVARVIRDSQSPEVAVHELVDYSGGPVMGESLAAHHDWRSGSTRLVALALFECGPREISTGELIPVWDLLPKKGHEMFQRIWTRGTDWLGAASANRIISAIRSPQSSRSLEILAARQQQQTLFSEDTSSAQPPEALASQAITEEALAALGTGDRLNFLALRAARIANIVDNFLQRRLT